jgi:hypothetical protein
LVFGKPSKSLFSFGQELQHSPTISKTEPKAVEAIPDIFADLNTQKFFFFHTNTNSARNLELDLCFSKTESIETIERNFDEKKEDMTLEFKRKHKSAFKREKKMKVI